MSMPKIYCPENDENKKPMPLLTVIQVKDGKLRVVCVDLNGHLIANLFEPEYRNKDAKITLEGEGYRTDWAEWDHEGRFIRIR